MIFKRKISYGGNMSLWEIISVGNRCDGNISGGILSSVKYRVGNSRGGKLFFEKLSVGKLLSGKSLSLKLSCGKLSLGKCSVGSCRGGKLSCGKLSWILSNLVYKLRALTFLYENFLSLNCGYHIGGAFCVSMQLEYAI